MSRALKSGACVLVALAEIGSIAPGKAADLIVLDRRLSAQSTADEVLATKVTKVFFAGRPLKP